MLKTTSPNQTSIDLTRLTYEAAAHRQVLDALFSPARAIARSAERNEIEFDGEKLYAQLKKDYPNGMGFDRDAEAARSANREYNEELMATMPPRMEIKRR